MKYDRGEIRNFRKSERFWEFGHSEVEIATTIENPIIDFLVPFFGYAGILHCKMALNVIFPAPLQDISIPGYLT